MNPLVLGSVAMLAGWIGKSWLDSHAKQEAQQKQNSELGLGAKELLQGKLYALSLMTNPAGIPTPIVQDFSQAVRAAFEGAGFTVTTFPAPRSPADESKFLSGQASEWLLQGIWTKTEKTVPTLPAWAGMVVAYEAPMQPVKY